MFSIAASKTLFKVNKREAKTTWVNGTMQSRQIYTLLPGNVYRNELISQIHVNFFPSKISLRFSYDFSEKEVPVNLRFQSISAKITDQKIIGNLLIYYSVSRRITSLNFSDGLPVIYSNVVFIYHF